MVLLVTLGYVLFNLVISARLYQREAVHSVHTMGWRVYLWHRYIEVGRSPNRP